MKPTQPEHPRGYKPTLKYKIYYTMPVSKGSQAYLVRMDDGKERVLVIADAGLVKVKKDDKLFLLIKERGGYRTLRMQVIRRIAFAC